MAKSRCVSRTTPYEVRNLIGPLLALPFEVVKPWPGLFTSRVRRLSEAVEISDGLGGPSYRTSRVRRLSEAVEISDGLGGPSYRVS